MPQRIAIWDWREGIIPFAALAALILLYAACFIGPGLTLFINRRKNR